MGHWTIGSFKQVKRFFRIVMGFTVLIIGLALVVLPGPAFIVIPLGLAILATELVWAKKLLDRVKNGAETIGQLFGIKKHTHSQDSNKKNSAL
ncbi:PGPGW domain-containing protein [bacterium]|nr:PGPGW domain-containing protein [bacterium]